MEEAAIDIMVPVMEISVYAAAKYANACHRNTVTSTDMEYGMKYAVMNCVGKQTGSHFDFDSEDESESESEYESDEDEFTRYEGTDELIQAMNKSYDAWGVWAPENPVEIMLKNAIDAQSKGVFNPARG